MNVTGVYHGDAMVRQIVESIKIGRERSLYNNKINARVLIGQSAMVYCAGKPMEKSHVF